MTAALTFPAGRESRAGDSAPRRVVNTSTATRIAIEEAMSRELPSEELFLKEIHRVERKTARRSAKKRIAELEASGLRLEKEEKREAAATRSISPGAPKMHGVERLVLVRQLISSGALQYSHADHGEEGRLAWDLAGNIMASREVRHREEHPNPVVSEERASIPAREGPPEVEGARKRQELQSYL